MRWVDGWVGGWEEGVGGWGWVDGEGVDEMKETVNQKRLTVATSHDRISFSSTDFDRVYVIMRGV